MNKDLVIGMDFGTDSARGVLVNPLTGSVEATTVVHYMRWKKGLYCNPEKKQYRQHPLDYVEAIDQIFRQLLVGGIGSRVAAISTNTTGSTPVPVNKCAVPLALTGAFAENPNAMFVLWKDHTALQEAEEINRLVKDWEVDYTRYSGGIYSSEWFWSKILHIHRQDVEVADAAYTWLEQSDWIPAYLTGANDLQKIKINRCAAGHKAMWNEEYGGLPSKEFLCRLDPVLAPLAERFYRQTYTSDEVFGTLSQELAKSFGMDPDTLITVGAIDAHHGAVGAGISPRTLVKVIGTSTCDLLVGSGEVPLVKGICGQVDGSILPGLIGFEAGQSAFGDIYSWFRQLMLKPLFAIGGNNLECLEEEFFDYITAEAAKLPVTPTDLVFTDYHNGRRTPDADFHLRAASYGWDLSTSAGHFFKALVEATAFGSRAIMERFREYQVPIEKVIACGGIPHKSPYVVQVLADVMGVEILVVDGDQTCALGAAIFAAKAAGFYSDIYDAQKVMAARTIRAFVPDPDKLSVYDTLYKTYKELTNLMK